MKILEKDKKIQLKIEALLKTPIQWEEDAVYDGIEMSPFDYVRELIDNLTDLKLSGYLSAIWENAGKNGDYELYLHKIINILKLRII